MTALYACLAVVFGVLGVALIAAWWWDRAIEHRHERDLARIRRDHECDGVGSSYNPRLRQHREDDAA